MFSAPQRVAVSAGCPRGTQVDGISSPWCARPFSARHRPIVYGLRRETRSEIGTPDHRGQAGVHSEVLQKTDLELRAAPQPLEIGLQGHADVELQNGLPRADGVPRDAESREPVETARGEAVLDQSLVERSLEAHDIGEIEGVLRARDPAAVIPHTRPGETAQAVAEEGELELTEAVELRSGLPDRLEAELLERLQKHPLADAELVGLVILLARVEVGQTGSGRGARERLVPPPRPPAAVTLLPRRGDRPGGAVELPLDPGRLDE